MTNNLKLKPAGARISCVVNNKRNIFRIFPRVLVLYVQYEMDKVLKSVGLSKRGTEIKNSQQTVSPERDQTTVISKRRRCENQRFLNHEKGLRGLFNIDWESVKDCKSKAMTRKLCGKRCNNELYRSNSFKFERFVRTGEETATLGHTVM